MRRQRSTRKATRKSSARKFSARKRKTSKFEAGACKPSGKASHKPYRVARSATGLGLFATAPIDTGAFIVAYRGRRIANVKAAQMEARGSRYMYEINSRWTIDGSSRRNVARYANHSCRPNAESDVVKGKIILRAIRAIKPGDEITYDYGREYFDLFLKPAGCKCIKCAQRRRRARNTRHAAGARRRSAASAA
jgi:SET domain-containing protein